MPSTSNARKGGLQKSPGSSLHTSVTRSQTTKSMNIKPVQESSVGQDSKLVEMINSVIVDRSPSVKWEDIGQNLRNIT